MPITLEEHLADLENPRRTFISRGLTPRQFAKDLKKLLKEDLFKALNLEAEVMGWKIRNQNVLISGGLGLSALTEEELDNIIRAANKS
jgi:hypothetical protein